MPRSLWTGSLSLGLVNVPVTMVSAVRDLDLHFRQLLEKDGAPIEVQRWCSEEDVEVPYEEISHGYECENGDQAIVTDLELEALEPRKTRTIDTSNSSTSTTSIRSISTTPTSCCRARRTTAPPAPTGCSPR